MNHFVKRKKTTVKKTLDRGSEVTSKIAEQLTI